MSTAIIFIIILGVLIFVHELGHFVTARRNGIKADEFGFGFPPRAIGFQFLYENGKRKKWRLIWGTRDGDDKEEKKDLEQAHKEKYTGGTIYSLNWIPLGGFVKIKGEDGGSEKELDSFASKSSWIRVKVLAAGVIMNFILAWILISMVFILGAPQPINPNDKNTTNSKIQVSTISKDAPAEISGMRIGDEILKKQKDFENNEIEIGNIEEFQNFINNNKGKEIILEIKRGKEVLNVKTTPRLDVPEGQGPLGVSLTMTAIVKYVWYEAILEGAKTTFSLIGAILMALGGIIKSLFMGQGVGADVAGPIGIATMTKDVAALGLVYIFQFTALLSINLGIINILPIPALDGGRILFILIERIKGKPISQKVEQSFHSIGFILLITLLVLVTFKDVMKFVK